MLSSKGLGLGSQSEVKIAKSFLTFWELDGNEQVVHTGTVKLHFRRFLWLLWKEIDYFHELIKFDLP